MSQLKTGTVALVAIVSSVGFLLSPLIASYIGNFTDQMLVARWAETKDIATLSDFMAAGEYVYGITMALIALIALTCGLLASITLYKRYKKQYDKQ